MMCHKRKKEIEHEKGFTIVELVVSVAIFAFMTSFLVAKYGTFNQSVLLTNTAYDVALTIRNAQAYGLNVKSRPETGRNYSDKFTFPYGVRLANASSANTAPGTRMIFYADLNRNGVYNQNEEITMYTLRGGSYISGICGGQSENSCTPAGSESTLDVTFKRPDPNAAIRINGDAVSFTRITITGPGGLTKKVSVRSTGQISVLQKN